MVLKHILSIFLIVNMVGVEELLCVKNLPFSPKYALGIAEEETMLEEEDQNRTQLYKTGAL